MSERFVKLPWAKPFNKPEKLTFDGHVLKKTIKWSDNKDPERCQQVALSVAVDNGNAEAFDNIPEWFDREEGEVVDPHRSFSIAASLMGEVEKKLKKLNKAAAKIGMPPVEIFELEHFTKRFKHKEYEGSIRLLPYILLYVKGEAPRLEGHTFLAKIEHTSEGNFIDTAPGVALDFETKRKADNYCDHCNSRRDRIHTFLLQKPDGGLTQVGRNCLANYIRGADPTGLLKIWKIFDEFGDLEEQSEVGGGGREKYSSDPRETLAYASRAIATYGWVSAAMARDSDRRGTSGVVAFAMSPPPRTTPGMSPSEIRTLQGEWKELQPTEMDEKVADVVIEWIEGLAGDSEYEYKLKLILKLGYVDSSKLALFVSAAGVYFRNLEQTKEREKAEEKRADQLNEHFGTVDERLDLTLEIVRVRTFDGAYGTTTILAFQDAEGRQFTWFASGDKRDEFDEGDFVTGKATVKKHDDYKGTAQTHLTRGKFKVVEQ